MISALVDGKGKHIPYRDSKLTRLLQDRYAESSVLLCDSSFLSTYRSGTDHLELGTNDLEQIRKQNNSSNKTNAVILFLLRTEMPVSQVHLCTIHGGGGQRRRREGSNSDLAFHHSFLRNRVKFAPAYLPKALRRRSGGNTF